MPFIFSERLPLPSVKFYCSISSLVFVASLLYARNVISEKKREEELDKVTDLKDLIDVYLNDQFLIWSLINVAYCGLFLFGKAVQHAVFGSLRLTEEQHLQDKFWNFVFYKLIFIFGVVNAQSLNEVLCWLSWFSMLGFFHILGQMSKDRFEYISASPATSRSTHTKLVILIFCIFLSSFLLGFIAVWYGYPNGLNIFAFMMEECILLALKSLHLLTRYAIQLSGFTSTTSWDRTAKIVYYLNLNIELLYYSIDLYSHFHMLLWSNVFLSMASLVLYWNIRTLFSEIRKKVKRHRTFKRILASVDNRFPFATPEQLEAFGDHCAICWEDMVEARKLPCSHYFHHSCLCAWLLQDLSCPTCRRSLSADIGMNNPAPQFSPDDVADTVEENENVINGNDNRGGHRNYSFYLDGRRIANWFPSFSIEVFHGRVEMQDQEVNDMGQQLFTMFPNISQDAILADLRRTHSIEATADNILEGNLSQEVTLTEDVTSTLDNDQQFPEPSAPLEVQNELVVTSDNVQHLSESEVEESSGTDDPSTNQDTDSDSRLVTSSLTEHGTGPTRRRAPHKIRKTASSGSASSDQSKYERDERRTLFLDAIERRNNKPYNT